MGQFFFVNLEEIYKLVNERQQTNHQESQLSENFKYRYDVFGFTYHFTVMKKKSNIVKLYYLELDGTVFKKLRDSRVLEISRVKYLQN